MSFSKLDLHADLARGVRAMGWIDPTPIQSQSIPLALEGADIFGCAQTGSGKTAAFAIPILQRLLSHPGPGLRALVVVPTRELAAQVETTFRDCGRFTPFKVALLIGGVGYHSQRQALSQGAQILVATPGRLLDQYKQGAVRFGRIEQLVLDEADRMLDMGFLPAIREIIGLLPKDRQTLFFSATLGPEIDRVASFAMRNPKRVEISRPTSVASGISQVVYPVLAQQKSELLSSILQSTQIRSGVVFCRTKHGADRLAHRLKEKGFSIGVLHADRTQGQRTAAMDSFRNGRVQILVATDIAARGIDVRDVSHVINYDVPRHPEDYVHRVGRTARAQGVGDAITLMAPDEQPFLSSIERFTGTVFPRAMLPTFAYSVKPILTPPKPKSFKDMNWSRFRRRRFSR
ncbi:MAG: DEAD/DEAH box helicase [Elusimicrobiota bacterium]